MTTEIATVTAQQAWQQVQDNQAVLLDIRDLKNFSYRRPPQAFHLTNQSYGVFLDRYDYDFPIVVMCYHGVSSLNVAHFLIEQGFDHVASVQGGFEGWLRAGLPYESDLQSE
ncbi:thiosulfate sulfurtransferase GlpE [Testudinibacter sp. TR-2022]|uniref:thiosulfate sulfurtransferase GlpE n=1 Tax=Testudinibacter sp. TR-2022 TaxID=2585029 RepID=UPI00111A2A92|nr:thiosulfate sulfurtransferase GlpE [Testudinibacter sp. TR-2022]TNH04589.1 thiosulfate sulfurtransferase GlpE [Pasteurellaceae bacterium Phil31]TNH09397.1 thiosulfate sulfurtransferase GlpE [Testudinibacter sp. TR-2022]TNH09816.1 thiosulfate sulfurtransferase GlpE [Testudinibacter sp. TR-2022]TNH13861.1 thiosulfate sulfurtransferase GlpE [Testudinibacter sp. TR-2022]TNH20670.1 thiosulfate sulfurtransferase GlpE [Testudinibacter sp. TR-2022]